MKRLLFIFLSVAVVTTGFLLETIPGYAQSQARTRNNLDSGLQFQQEGTGTLPKSVNQQETGTTPDAKTRNTIRRNTISKDGKDAQ